MASPLPAVPRIPLPQALRRRRHPTTAELDRLHRVRLKISEPLGKRDVPSPYTSPSQAHATTSRHIGPARYATELPGDDLSTQSCAASLLDPARAPQTRPDMVGKRDRSSSSTTAGAEGVPPHGAKRANPPRPVTSVYSQAESPRHEIQVVKIVDTVRVYCDGSRIMTIDLHDSALKAAGVCYYLTEISGPEAQKRYVGSQPKEGDNALDYLMQIELYRPNGS